VAGSLTRSPAPDGTGTKVTQICASGGYRHGGFAELAPLVDQVMLTQLQRLQRYPETPARRGRPRAGASAPRTP
jgi:hypothetical protein